MAISEFAIKRAYQTNQRGPLRWVGSHTVRHYWPILGVVIGALANAALAGLVPVLLGVAFDAMMEGPPLAVAVRPDYRTVGLAALGVIASQFARAVLQLMRNFSAEVIGQRLERDARDELYASLIGKSMTFHNLQPVGDTMARATNDVREINFMLNPGINLVIGSGMFLIMPSFFAFNIHPALAIIPTVFVIGYVLMLWEYLHTLQPISERVRRTFGAMNSRLAEAIDGIETVKGASQEQAEISRFHKLAGAYRDAFVHQGRIEARFLPLLLVGITQAVAFWHAAVLFRAGEILVGDVVAYMGLIALFGFPVFVSLFAYSQVSLGVAGARRILELIKMETELDENVGGHEAAIEGAITFENVTFDYKPGVHVLADVSFQVQPGQTVAIVGQTGAGKTTLVKLISRIYDTTAGRVLVDGVDVRDWRLESLRRQISIIEQDIFLFSRTLAENIAFGYPDATQAEIEQAAREAQAHEFILSFQDGYETVVGERGVTLSGGQRQRIALARAFLADPRILVLDDSTSAIDSATEDQIQRAIRRAAERQTTLLITHRLSQIRWADLIVVLRKGQIAAVGTHDDLLKSSEAYRRIFKRYEGD